MNVGSIVEFSAMVTYSKGNAFVVQVIAEDVSPLNATRTRTNELTFIFRLVSHYYLFVVICGNDFIVCDSTPTPSSSSETAGKSLPVALPSTYGDILNYLEGKRALDLLV